MKNNKLLIGLGILTAVAVGYFMFKSKKKQQTANNNQSGEPFIDESTIPPLTTETDDKKDSPVTRAGAAIGAALGLLNTNTGGFSDYVVITNTSNLNVRKSPSTSATIIGTVAKNAKIKARASSSKDWFEYSKDGKTVTGYVSAAYLKKI